MRAKTGERVSTCHFRSDDGSRSYQVRKARKGGQCDRMGTQSRKEDESQKV